MILTRRSLFQLAGLAIAPWSVIRALAAADFWNTKDPDAWTADDIAKLMKKSPWAREVTGELLHLRPQPDQSAYGNFAIAQQSHGTPRRQHAQSQAARLQQVHHYV
jgi:hypothetical protein